MGLYSDLSLNQGQYIPQYAGSPLAEMKDTGDVLAGRHYQNIAQATQLQLLANKIKSELLPEAKGYVDTHIESLNSALQDMAKNGGENSTARINALATALQGDQGILNAVQRTNELKAKQALIDKITSDTGHKAVYHQKKIDELMKAPVMTKDAEGNTILNPIYNQPFQLDVSPYMEPNLDYKKITDEVKPDKWLAQGLTGEDLITFNKKFTQLQSGEIDVPKFVSWAEAAGISRAKLQGLKDEMFKAYKNTKSYEQQKEYFNKTDAQMAEDILNYANLGVFNQLDKHYQQISGGGAGAGSGKTTTPETRKEYTGAEQVKQNWDYSLDAVGKEPERKTVAQTTAKAQYPITGAKQAIQNQNTGEVFTNAQVDPQELLDRKYKKEKSNYDEIMKKFSRDADVAMEIFYSPDQVAEGYPKGLSTDRESYLKSDRAKKDVAAYRKMVEDLMVSTPVSVYTDSNVVKDKTEDIMRVIDFRKAYNVKEGVANTVLDNKEDVREEFGDLTRLLKDGQAQVIGMVDPKGPYAQKAGLEYANAYVVSFKDDESEKRNTFLVTPSEQELSSPEFRERSLTHQIYNQAGYKKGAWNTVTPKDYSGGRYFNLPTMQVKELIGNQKPPGFEGTELLKVKIGPEELMFTSYEELAAYLRDPSQFTAQ